MENQQETNKFAKSEERQDNTPDQTQVLGTPSVAR